MPVTVSLEALVSVPGTRPLWPDEFRALVDELEANPDDKVRWGVVADWVEDRGEPEYAAAFRWVGKRDGVKVSHKYNGSDRPYWWPDGVPEPMELVTFHGCDTLPGMVERLAARLREVRKMVE